MSLYYKHQTNRVDLVQTLTSLSSHRYVTCSRHHIAEKCSILALNNNHSLTRDVAQIDIPTLLDVRAYGDRLLIVLISRYASFYRCNIQLYSIYYNILLIEYNFHYSCLTKYDLSIETTRVYSFGKMMPVTFMYSRQMFYLSRLNST